MKNITKHQAYLFCTQCHLDMLEGNEVYADNYSLSEALKRIEALSEDIITKEDIVGYRNPYLDMLAEELE